VATLSSVLSSEIAFYQLGAYNDDLFRPCVTMRESAYMVAS
jgi:hypothetical protein